MTAAASGRLGLTLRFLTTHVHARIEEIKAVFARNSPVTVLERPDDSSSQQLRGNVVPSSIRTKHDGPGSG